jgi:uncharacterized protein
MKKVVVFLITAYQQISPYFHRLLGVAPGTGCRFNPTCSEYMKISIEKYGVVKGVRLGLGQLSRCHPWAKD